MSKNAFENKIRKHHKRSTKSFRMTHDELEFHNRDFDLSINDIPPDPIDHEPTVNVGDIVSIFDYDYKIGEIERCGIVIGARWYRVEKSVRFSKKRGEWVSKYASVPRATVMWSDGEISNIFMNLLIKKDV